MGALARPVFVPEYEIATPAKDRRYVDGALVHELRVPFGYWEAKDEKDDLDAEIDYKNSAAAIRRTTLSSRTRPERFWFRRRQEVIPLRRR